MEHIILRKCLREIRNLKTLPCTVLSNGFTAEETAHVYVLKGNQRRNSQKRKREVKKVRKGKTNEFKQQSIKPNFVNTATTICRNNSSKLSGISKTACKRTYKRRKANKDSSQENGNGSKTKRIVKK